MNFIKVLILSCLLFASELALSSSKKSFSEEFFTYLPKSLITFLYKQPELSSLSEDPISDEIKYGFELIQNTSKYIGPNGTVGKYLGNKMNCSSCHMEAGRRLFGGSFGSTHANYPEYRARENVILSLADRINSCILRPHNGKPLPHDSREMRAMLIYIKWLGGDRPLNSRRFGDKLMELHYLDRAADPIRGQVVYEKHCTKCHGPEGQGKLSEDNVFYVFPPLWGPNGYSIGSSMHRVTAAAAFIKNNMPFGTTWENPVLTDEEAFDVAAFINDDSRHERPKVDVSKDYPNLLEKPIDYPFGPYADKFNETQHKFGPYLPIKAERKNK